MNNPLKLKQHCFQPHPIFTSTVFKTYEEASRFKSHPILALFCTPSSTAAFTGFRFSITASTSSVNMSLPISSLNQNPYFYPSF